MSAILFRVYAGAEGVIPGDVRMESTDDLVDITTPGYLNLNDGGTQILSTDIITAVYGPSKIKQLFTPSITNGVVTLVAFGGGGSINGAVNLGAGQGLLGVSGDNITGKSLIAGANISLTPTATDITISATGSGGGTITGITDVGIGQGHLSAGTSGANVQVKTLVEGSGVVITENSTTITIAATAPPPSGITTLANLPGGEGIYASTVGTVAQLKSIAAGAGIDISSTPNTIVITNVGGGGGSNFQYDQTMYVAANGNNANDGQSINTPKLTIQNAVNSFASPTANNAINIVDGGTYGGAVTLPLNCKISILARGATLLAPFNFSGTGYLTLDCYSFGTTFTSLLTMVAGSLVNINTTKIFGDINMTGGILQVYTQEWAGGLSCSGGTFIVYADSIAGGVVDTSGSPGAVPRNGLFVSSISGTGVSSTNSQIYGFVPVVNGGVSGIGQGLFDGVIYGLSFLSSSINTYVSQLIGSDATGNGTFDNPYATIQFAVTSLGTPANPTAIVILDGQTYNEAVTISSHNINLIGPEAALSKTGSGTALTFTTNATQHFVNMGAIFGSSGATALANTGTASIVSTGEVIDGPISTVNGQVFIRAVQLTGSYASSGSGFIRYTSTFRSGVDGFNTVGTSATGTLTNWSVANQLIASGLNYPTSDGSNGYVVTTNGAGTLTLQPLPASVLPYTTIAGTSQAAAVNNGYVIGNAAQTTVTLPATAAVGDRVAIMGFGAGGWIAQANGGQTIQVASSSSTAGGTATSAAASDNVVLVCIVANTTWSAESVISTGLVLA